jgi:hypothetical protein
LDGAELKEDGLPDVALLSISCLPPPLFVHLSLPPCAADT